MAVELEDLGGGIVEGYYATELDLEIACGGPDRLAVLLADEQGDELEGRLAAALAAADSEIDSALANFYGVPVAAPVPSQVVRWATDLALGELVRDRGDVGGLRAHADEARAALKEVQAGHLAVPGLTKKDAVGGIPEAGRTFTRGEDRTDGSGGTLDKW
jgi:phage gp36-like protein